MMAVLFSFLVALLMCSSYVSIMRKSMLLAAVSSPLSVVGCSVCRLLIKSGTYQRLYINKIASTFNC